MASLFIPRNAFPALQNLPRSYYLGHHAKGLQQMKRMLAQVDLIIECRDYRVPLTSRNPLFEETLAGRPRVIVYTKRDLGIDSDRAGVDIAKQVRSYSYYLTPSRKYISSPHPQQEKTLKKWHAPTPSIFISSHT